MPTIPSQTSQTTTVGVEQSSSAEGVINPGIDTGNHDDTSNTRGRVVTIDVNGVTPQIMERDGNLSVVQEQIVATEEIVLTLPDPGEGFEIRYTTSSKNPTHKSTLYEGPITFTSNLTGVDNTVLKFRIYSTTNHTVRGRIYKLNLRVT